MARSSSVLGLLALWACLQWAGAQPLEREDISGNEVLLRPCVLEDTHKHTHTRTHTHNSYVHLLPSGGVARSRIGVIDRRRHATVCCI
jgi:hypothetical protein